jgi:hypothetical protein
MNLYLMANGGIADVTKPVAADEYHDEVLRWFDELRDPCGAI